MKPFRPINPINEPAPIVIDLEDEKRIEREAQGIVELHDFLKAHPDSAAKEVAKFMPPVDSRAVSKAMQIIILRDKKI